MVLAAVAFDLDGTLFDHRTAARRGLRAWLTGLGVAWDEQFAEAWASAEGRHFDDWRDGRISFSEQRRRRLRDVLPLIGRPVGDDEQLDAVFAGYLGAYERAWCGYPDVAPALDQLHSMGLSTAVLTNGSTDQQHAKLAHLGLLALGRRPRRTASRAWSTWLARSSRCSQADVSRGPRGMTIPQPAIRDQDVKECRCPS